VNHWLHSNESSKRNFSYDALQLNYLRIYLLTENCCGNAEGKTVAGCEDFDFSFGGRRQFCKSGYADLGKLVSALTRHAFSAELWTQRTVVFVFSSADVHWLSKFW